MAEITQADYNTWKTATFGDGYYIWHEGLPTEAVTSLSGDARAHAVRMLTFGIQKLDGHAAAAVAAMDETSALPYLRTALPAASGETRVDIAKAINHLSREEDSATMAKELVSVLQAPDEHWSTTMSAAIGLKGFKDKESEEALLEAVEKNEHYLVKYHSCETLLARWGVEPSGISSHEDIFALIRDVREEDAIQDEAKRGKEAAKLMRKLKK